jgi:signal peptidase II
VSDSPTNDRDAASWLTLLPVLLATVVVLLDQATKMLVTNWLGPDASRHRVVLIDSVLAFHYAENSGAAFGVMRGQVGLLTVLSVVVVAGLVWYYRRTDVPSPWLVVSLGLLLGGAFGNLIDRIRLGYVVDFVAVGVWPKFNVADSAITVGVALLALQLMTDGAKGDRQRSQPTGKAEPR